MTIPDKSHETTAPSNFDGKNRIEQLVRFISICLIGHRTSELTDELFDGNQDFVSEDYDTTDINMDDIRREIEQSSIAKKNSTKTKSSSPGKIPLTRVIFRLNDSFLFFSVDLDEGEWVKALADELENVSTDQLESVSVEELEAQINEVLSGKAT